MDPEYIEGVASSLVREYLSRKGLKETLLALDKELPRSEYSINNRPKLMKTLHLEKLMKRNKEQEQPLRAMIEVISKHYLEKGGRVNSAGVTDSRDSLSADDRPRTAGSDVSESSTLERPRRSRHEKYETKSLDRPKKSKKEKNDILGAQASEREQEDPSYYDTQSLDRRRKSKERDCTSESDGLFMLNGRPNSSSSTASDRRSCSGRPRGPRGGSSNMNDLVIEDDLESETVLGHGKAGIMDELQNTDSVSYMKKPTPRPISSRHRGLGGPVTSNLEERDKRRLTRPKTGSASRGARLLTGQIEPTEDSAGTSTSGYSSLASTTNHSNHHNNRASKKDDIPVYPSFPSQPSSIKSADVAMEPPIINHERNRIKEGPTSISDLLANARKNKVKMNRASRRSASEDIDLDDDSSSYDLENSSISSDKVPTRGSNKSEPSRSVSLPSKEGDLEIGDIDDIENELSEVDLGPKVVTSNKAHVTSASAKLDSQPIDLHIAIRLKKLLFGTAMQSFNDEWKYQGFSFSDIPKLQYGIVQKKGGPCGVLASVQACVLQELLFGEGRKPSSKSLEPRRHERSQCLALALTNILWRAGGDKHAVIALPGRKALFFTSSKFKGDGLTETLILYKFTKYEDLRDFIKQNVEQFEMEGTSGVILALYSVIFSRTIDSVISDMDEPTDKLMGAHGYCSQDMVNLFLCGRAVSNVFNDIVELEFGEGKSKVLKGIMSRSNIGLLSLFEHYKSCQVGTFLKTPKYPIWVVCSESHFSVLFALKRELISDWKAERRFDLYYFDGLGKQDEEIRLTVDTTNRFFQPPSDDDLVPPIELCIRTKWSDAEIDWNGTEPLL